MKTDLKGLFKELQKFVHDEKIKKERNGENTERSARSIFFSDKLSVKNGKVFSKKWGMLYNYRNAVAHGKTICKADYENAVELTKMFEECMGIIDTLKMNNEQAEAIEAVAQQVISKNPANVLAESVVLHNSMGTDEYKYRISTDPNTITAAVNNLRGMSIAYSADEIYLMAQQAASYPDLPGRIIPESGMGRMLDQNGVTGFLNGRIFIDGSKQ